MSSNLLKRGYTCIAQEDTRIIDSNTLLAQKLSTPAPKKLMPKPEDKDGFAAGLSADILEVLTEDTEGAAEGAKEEMQPDMAAFGGEPEAEAGPSPEELRNQALAEIEAMKKEAEAQLLAEREQVLSAAKQEGYQEGFQQGNRETQAARKALEEEKMRLAEEYEKQLDEIEPAFVETIAGIYEHIFQVELSGYRDIVVNLIARTLRKVEGGRMFIVHVSKEDYPYVSMQRKQLEAGVATGNSTLEIVEDITLSKNQAMIETEGGIFDCGLGTQLAELHQKLMLLAYEKPES